MVRMLRYPWDDRAGVPAPRPNSIAICTVGLEFFGEDHACWCGAAGHPISERAIRSQTLLSGVCAGTR